MENIKVSDIVKAAGGRLLCGNPDQPLEHICIDSRQLRGNDLFVPLMGEKNDAHRFIPQVMEQGAAASLTSRHDAAPEGLKGALIRVEDTKKALQAVGSFLRMRLSIPLVGITGSVGKTTTREMVAAALSAGYRVFKTPANYNSQVGVPITLSEIAAGDEIGVLELGMSEPGEMEVIARIAAVDMAVITNVGVAHIENLGSRANILKEKLHIQDSMKAGGSLLLNGDNDLLKTVTANEGYKTVYYGTGENCGYRAVDIRLEEGKPVFTMVCEKGRIPVRLQVLGEHNILNALAALAVADHYQVSLEAAAEKLFEFSGFENRQQVYQADGVTIIDDTYNASPDSMRAGIQVLSSFTDSRRRVAVLADMKELGEDEVRFHREIGDFLQTKPVELLVTYGTLAKEIALAASKGKGAQGMDVVSFSSDEKDAMTVYLEKNIQAGDAVLFKGSNSMRLFETAAHFIKTGQVKE